MRFQLYYNRNDSFSPEQGTKTNEVRVGLSCSQLDGLDAAHRLFALSTLKASIAWRAFDKLCSSSKHAVHSSVMTSIAIITRYRMGDADPWRLIEIARY